MMMKKSTSENSLVKLYEKVLNSSKPLTKSLKKVAKNKQHRINSYHKNNHRMKKSSSSSNIEIIELSSDMNDLLLSKSGKKSQKSFSKATASTKISTPMMSSMNRMKKSTSDTSLVSLLLNNKNNTIQKNTDDVKNINGIKKSTSENSLVDLAALSKSSERAAAMWE